MAYPLRFFGTGKPTVVEGTTLPGRMTVEVTFRVREERLLLLPDAEATEIVGGCFGRAANRYPALGLHAVKVLGNHGHFLATPDRAATMSCFMRDFKSTVHHRVAGLRDYGGIVWQRRYRCIPITDEAKLEDKLAYVLTQGTKENLVERADQWPGLCSIRALRGGPPLVGRWRDHAAERELRKQRWRKIERAAAQGVELRLGDVPRVYRDYEIKLEPLPHWRNLPEGTRRQRVAAIVEEDAKKTRARHKRNRTRPLGVAGVLRANPTDQPEKSKKSPAPLCHASSPAERRAFQVVFAAFCERVRDSARRLVEARDAACVPNGYIAGPVVDSAVLKRTDDVAPRFEGGDPRLHFDPTHLGSAATFHGDTGPPRS